MATRLSKAVAATLRPKEVTMKASMLKNVYWLVAAIAASLMWICPQKSFATDTVVTCKGPQVQLAAGRDGTKPRVTIYCSLGSSVTGIDYFAAEISANSAVAAAIPGLVASWVLENGKGSSITINSDLSDTSGAAWGCGADNCRIIDYLLGY
jgi:hypothetical protein